MYRNYPSSTIQDPLGLCGMVSHVVLHAPDEVGPHYTGGWPTVEVRKQALK